MIDDMDIDIKALSEAVGVSNTNMWFYFHGKRKWNLETWLDTLACLGLVKTTANSIIIQIPPDKEERKHFSMLRRQRKKFVREEGSFEAEDILTEYEDPPESEVAG
jgi:hypothetical protein